MFINYIICIIVDVKFAHVSHDIITFQGCVQVLLDFLLLIIINLMTKEFFPANSLFHVDDQHFPDHVLTNGRDIIDFPVEFFFK